MSYVSRARTLQCERWLVCLYEDLTLNVQCQNVQGMVSWLPWMEEHAGSSPVILTVHISTN
jgi:hypothetical protein